MQVRHNTSLLEQAVEQIVRSAAIPGMRAEAEAKAKMLHAQARRRLATGFAIAAAAVGIGIGIYLANVGLTEPNHPVDARQPELKSPGPEIKESSTPHEPKENSRLPETKDTGSLERDPDIVTTDFHRFNRRKIDLLGREWEIVTGHYFETETDASWKHAWCYTNMDVDGVAIKIELAARSSPTENPVGPIATQKTLDEAQLTEADALGLATKCVWLDSREFKEDEFSPLPGRVSAPQNSPASYTMRGNTLVFEGPIQDDFAAKLVGLEFAELQIDSRGGSLVQAMAAGRLLRQRGVTVTANSECFSACVLVLAGGMVRQARENARIGVHRFYLSAIIDGNEATDLAQQMSSEILQYFSQMGVDPELFHKMAATPSHQMVLLSHDELHKWNLLGGSNNGPKSKSLMTYLGHDASGGDYRRMEKVSFADCEDSCKGDSNCQAITYDRWNKLCFLKSQVGVLRRDPRSTVVVKSGVKVEMDNRPITYFQRKGHAFSDKPFEVTSAHAFGQCLSVCSQNEACEAVNYTGSTRECSLLRNVTPYKQNPIAVLGMKLQSP